MNDSILLPSDPAEAGRIYGRLVAPALRDRIAQMRRVAEAASVSEATLHERGERFRGFVRRIAPEWLDEAEAVASAAGVAPADLYALNALPNHFWAARPAGCTACLVAGSASAAGATLLHKNRDVVDSTQDLLLRRLDDGSQYLASRDIGSLGIAHLHSGRALAGANNTGSPVPPVETRDCGLLCTHVLRLVAERASTCDEAVAAIEDAIAREVAGGSSPQRGSIFLLAEPTHGVVVETTTRRFAVREVRDDALIRTNHFLIEKMLPYRLGPPDANTLCRCARAHELLDPLSRVAPEDLARLARDHHDGPDSICCDDSQHVWMTVSACTHVVHRADSLAAHTRAAVGSPRNTLFLPIPRAIAALPAECVSGAFHDLARTLYARQGVGDHLAAAQQEHEPELVAEFTRLAADLAGASPDRARAELAAFVARSVARTHSLLEALTVRSSPSPSGRGTG
jgi:hypothetical protein